MTLLELLEAKRQRLSQCANQNGALGEARALEMMKNWLPRPRGSSLRNLLQALKETGIEIKGRSFDFISVKYDVDFSNIDVIKKALPDMNFIEIKSSSSVSLSN